MRDFLMQLIGVQRLWVMRMHGGGTVWCSVERWRWTGAQLTAEHTMARRVAASLNAVIVRVPRGIPKGEPVP